MHKPLDSVQESGRVVDIRGPEFSGIYGDTTAQTSAFDSKITSHPIGFRKGIQVEEQRKKA